jgi:p70 ribosomal S6 kinase
VLLVRNRLNQRKYAMKVISKKLIRKKNHIQYMRSEKAILTKVTHPFIVGLKFAFQSDTKLFLVMSFLGGGELFYHLKRRGLIREHEARFYCGEMILAIDFLHSMGIVHRDLKPENVLLDWEGHVTLTDFGLAKEIGEGCNVRTLCGTSEYMAPEMLVRNGYGKAVDWWSLGALLFEMLVGTPPFTASKGGGQKELDRKIMSERPSFPSYLTAPAHSLLKSLLEKDPSKRLGCAKGTMFSIGGVSALKNHAFFRDIDWACLLGKTHGPPPIAITAQEGDTCHFHEGFTSQCLSPSVVEDSLSPGPNSPACSLPATPLSRSRAHSFGDAFDDFAYSEPGELQVTASDLEAFEVTLLGKVRAQQKKKAKRAKQEGVRAARLAAEETEAALVAAQREQEARAGQLRAALEALHREQRRAEGALEAGVSAQRASSEVAAQRAQVAQGELQEQRRRGKRLQKRLKEIVQLAQKTRGELSAEQRLKLERRQEVEDDLAETEELEEAAEVVWASASAEQAREDASLEGLQRELEALRVQHRGGEEPLGGLGGVLEGSGGGAQVEDEAGQKQRQAEGAAVTTSAWGGQSALAVAGASCVSVMAGASSVSVMVDTGAGTGGALDKQGHQPAEGVKPEPEPKPKPKPKPKPATEVWEKVATSKKGQKKRR